MSFEKLYTMAGSVENILLGKEIGKNVRKNYNSPNLPRKTISNVRAVNDNSKPTLIIDSTMDSECVNSAESQVARVLASDYVRYKVGTKKSGPSSIHTETLRRVGDEIEEKYQISLSGIVKQLQYDPDNDGKNAIYASLNAMFEEGPCSWGRVVMVYVFAAYLAKYCQDHNKDPKCISDIITFCGDYVATHLNTWITKQGGWDDFCDKFKAKDWKDKAVFNSLVFTGLVLSSIATLRFFTK